MFSVLPDMFDAQSQHPIRQSCFSTTGDGQRFQHQATERHPAQIPCGCSPGDIAPLPPISTQRQVQAYCVPMTANLRPQFCGGLGGMEYPLHIGDRDDGLARKGEDVVTRQETVHLRRRAFRHTRDSCFLSGVERQAYRIRHGPGIQHLIRNGLVGSAEDLSFCGSDHMAVHTTLGNTSIVIKGRHVLTQRWVCFRHRESWR